MFVQFNNNWGGLTPENKQYNDELYEKYVPSCGKSDTIAGEIIRAINRICYKFYNDGDTVKRYYSSSYNHSWACDKFLEEHVPGYESMRELEDEEFELPLSENFNYILNWLRDPSNAELFAEGSNEEDCLDDAPYQEWEDEEEDYEDDYYYEDDDNIEDDVEN